MPAILWTNSYLSEIEADLAAIRAMHVDILLSYPMSAAASDADMLAYLDALHAAGLRALINATPLTRDVVQFRSDKAFSVGELATLAAFVDKWKTHPATWGWYTDDEGGPGYTIAARQQVYDTIKAAHPAGQVVEVAYLLHPECYSPAVHDAFGLDVGPATMSYVYYYSDYGPYGCINSTTGLVQYPDRENQVLDLFEQNLASFKSILDAAGETNYFVCMQAFGQGWDGGQHFFAMPPVGGISRMWTKAKTAGYGDYGVGWFLWKSNAALTMPWEHLHGVGESYAAQCAEIAAIAGSVWGVADAPTFPTYSVVIGAAGAEPSEDVTELVDLETLHRSLSERGEASATIDIPVASENEVPSNLLARDATVAVDIDGEREWLGHVVAVHKPQPQDLSYTLDCAGGWDTLHHCAPWCKGFVETRYDQLVQVSAAAAWDIGLLPSTAATMDTDGQLLLMFPKGGDMKWYQGIAAGYWLFGGMDPDAHISRVTFDWVTGGNTTSMYCVATLQYGLYDTRSAFAFFLENVQPPGSGSADFDVDVELPGFVPGALVFMVQGEAEVTLTADTFLQIRNLRIYVDRTTAPRVDEIVAAIDAEVRPGAPAASTEAIGAPLAAFMLDPFTTPADGIAVALTKAAVPPLCGVIQNQLIVKNRPTAPPYATRLWTVSEQLTPGLEWGVEVDEEQSVDYVGVAYNVVGSGNLIPAMTSATAPSGVVTSSGDLSTAYAKWKAFDHLNTDPSGYAWVSPVTTGYVQYQFPVARIITQYAVTSRNESAAPHSPKTWTFKGSNNGSTWVTLDTRTNITDWATLPNVRKAFPLANSTAYAYYRLDITASNGIYVGVGELEMMESNVPDGTPRIAYYPSAPPNAAARSALTDGGDLTAAEAAFYAQQGDYFLHKLVSGPVTIPYVVQDANGNERPADVIRAWDWVQNVGSLDAETAGPFLVSEVEHQGHIATLTIGAAEAYAYNGPDRMPTKGRYVGAHRVRTRTTQRVSFAKYWAWKHRKDKRKPKMPRHHARYGTIRGWKWTDVEGKYV